MSKRKQIGKKARFEIFKRDGFSCQYCGGKPPGVLLQVDHIHPVKDGGDNREYNLITACAACNIGKGARLLNVAPQSLKERAEEVAEREAQIVGYTAIMDAERSRIEQDAWRVAEILDPKAALGYPRANLVSIRRFVKDLGVHEVMKAADMAIARRPHSNYGAFKYFCGICWNWTKDGVTHG